MCNVVPWVLKQHWIRFFSYAILPGASRATLHGVFICAILCQEYHLLGQHFTGKTLCSVALEALDNITEKNVPREFGLLCNVVPRTFLCIINKNCAMLAPWNLTIFKQILRYFSKQLLPARTLKAGSVILFIR